MISYIKGEIVKKGTDSLIIDNNGIGYNINTSLSTLNKVSEGENTCVYTYLHIREDAMLFYGFSTIDELDMFKKLISVNGIGPKAGLSFLSTYEISNLKVYLIKEDAAAISKVPGIGKKTAQKVILELKDKLGKLEDLPNADLTDSQVKKISTNSYSEDTIAVLMSLGFTQSEANSALDSIDLAGKTENQIIKEALKNLNR